MAAAAEFPGQGADIDGALGAETDLETIRADLAEEDSHLDTADRAG